MGWGGYPIIGEHACGYSLIMESMKRIRNPIRSWLNVALIPLIVTYLKTGGGSEFGLMILAVLVLQFALSLRDYRTNKTLEESGVRYEKAPVNYGL
jgi:hypothetical protein